MPNYEIIKELKTRFGETNIRQQITADEIPTIWVSSVEIKPVLTYLKNETARPFKMLYDLTAVDERQRVHHDGFPESDFTIVYHLTSFGRNIDIRV